MAQTVKNLPVMKETWVWSSGSGRSPREENGYPLQYSCLENSMDRGAWVLQSNKELDTTEHLTLSLFAFKGDWKLYILFFFFSSTNVSASRGSGIWACLRTCHSSDVEIWMKYNTEVKGTKKQNQRINCSLGNYVWKLHPHMWGRLVGWGAFPYWVGKKKKNQGKLERRLTWGELSWACGPCPGRESRSRVSDSWKVHSAGSGRAATTKPLASGACCKVYLAPPHF